MLIPEFAELVKRDKGSKGDYRGDKKLKAKRELAFIYFDLDFTSPIYNYPEYERREEAMRFAGLEEKDMDAVVMAAHAVYRRLLLSAARSLRTLQAMEKGLDKLDDYFENIDFTLQDKKGELVHDPSKFVNNVKNMGPAYDAVDKFRKRVEEELSDTGSIRGNAQLGRLEGKREKIEEKGPAVRAPQTNFHDIGVLLEGGLEGEEEEQETL